MENPFEALVPAWLGALEAGRKAKDSFEKNADEGLEFFNGPATNLLRPEIYAAGEGLNQSAINMPAFPVVMNKVSEGTQLFAPSMYHQNPDRTVSPRRLPMLPPEVLGNPMDPQVMAMHQAMMMQMQMEQAPDKARASLLEHYLDVTPYMLDLEANGRKVVEQALIEGCSFFHHVLYTPPGVKWRMAGSFYRSHRDILFDPDLLSMDAARWCAIRYIEPVWMVEDKYGVPRGTWKKKGTHESPTAANIPPTEKRQLERLWGESCDLMVYYEFYSKLGMGSLIKGCPEEAAVVDVFGPYRKLCISPTVDYPLNVPKEILQDKAAVEKATRWDTPYWLGDSWPVTPCAFHWVPDQLWPQSHWAPAMGELKFMNYMVSALATKISVALKDWIAISAGVEEDFKKGVQSPGGDYKMLILSKLTAGARIEDVVQFLQHPPFHPQSLEILKFVMDSFDRRTGLTELMYGQTGTQSRSSADIQIKEQQASIRPDDMAKQVERVMGVTAWKESLCARWHLEPADLEPILGKIGTHFWGQFVATQNPSQLVHGLEYRTEAGSLRKPNVAKESEDATTMMQTLWPNMWEYAAATGDSRPANMLLRKFGKAQQLPDEEIAALMISAMPPPTEGAPPVGTKRPPPAKPAGKQQGER